MSAWEKIKSWTPVDKEGFPPVDAVYMRDVTTRADGERVHRLVRLPIVGLDNRDCTELVLDPCGLDTPVRVQEIVELDSTWLYLGVYNHGRQPSWAALEGAKAILADRGPK